MNTAPSEMSRRQACSRFCGEPGRSVQRTFVAEVDDATLGELVLRNADARTRDPEVWSAVTAPDLIDRSLAVLRAMHQDNLAAMQTRKADHKRVQASCSKAGAGGRSTWLQANADYEQWRAGAAQLDGTLTRALGAVNAARKDRLQEAFAAKNFYRAAVRDLALAIHHHRDVTASVGDPVAVEAGRNLWGVLDRICVPMGPNDQPRTLKEMVPVWLGSE